MVGVQAELLYSTKGSTTNYSALFDLVDQEVDFNLNYIELPILASVRLAEIVDLQLGGYAAYLLSANVSSSGDLGSGSEELDRDNFKSMDFGIAGGVAFNVGSNLQVGVRYLHGLNDIADSDASDLVLGDAKNRVAQLYLGVGLGGN
jgi:opacity protein-like surface antigen